MKAKHEDYMHKAMPLFCCVLSILLLAACKKPHSGVANGIVTTGAVCADVNHHPGSVTEPKLGGPGRREVADPSTTIGEGLAWNVVELDDGAKADIITELEKPANGIFYFRGHGAGTSGSPNAWLDDAGEDGGDGSFKGMYMGPGVLLNASDMGGVKHAYVLAFINCCFSGGDPAVGGIQTALTADVYMGWNTKVAKILAHYYASMFFEQADSGKSIGDAADAAYRSCLTDNPAYMINRPAMIKRGLLTKTIDRRP